jgi:hypothetical protein
MFTNVDNLRYKTTFFKINIFKIMAQVTLLQILFTFVGINQQNWVIYMLKCIYWYGFTIRARKKLNKQSK